MDADQTGRDVWSDLVDGVLDTRTEEATRRFDADLATAVADGDVSEPAAQKLRAWQRASIRELAEHVRTVLPATMRAVESAREDALASAQDMARHLVGGAAPESSPPVAGASGAAPDVAKRAPDAGRPPSTGAARVAQPRVDVRRAAPAPPGQPRTLEERRPRLLVADLTDTRKDRTN